MPHGLQYIKNPHTDTTQFFRQRANFAALAVALTPCFPATAELSPPFRPETVQSTESMPASYQDISLLLRSVIYSLMKILDVSDIRPDLDQQGFWLDLDALTLVSAYAASGVLEPLAAPAIAGGQADCQEALDIIDTYGSELEMSGVVRILLRQTLVDMKQELDHAL